MSCVVGLAGAPAALATPAPAACRDAPGLTFAQDANWRVFEPAGLSKDRRWIAICHPASKVPLRRARVLDAGTLYGEAIGVGALEGDRLVVHVSDAANVPEDQLIDLRTGHQHALESDGIGSSKYQDYPVGWTAETVLPNGGIIRSREEYHGNEHWYRGDVSVSDRGGTRLVAPGVAFPVSDQSPPADAGPALIAPVASANGVYVVRRDQSVSFAAADGEATGVRFTRNKQWRWHTRVLPKVSHARTQWRKRVLTPERSSLVLRERPGRAEVVSMQSSLSGPRGESRQLAALAPSSASQAVAVDGRTVVARFADDPSRVRLRVFGATPSGTGWGLDIPVDASALQPGNVASAGGAIAIAEPAGVSFYRARLSGNGFDGPFPLGFPGAGHLVVAQSRELPAGTANDVLIVTANDGTPHVLTRGIPTAADAQAPVPMYG